MADTHSREDVKSDRVRVDKQFGSWYSTDNILRNAITIIPAVAFDDDSAPTLDMPSDGACTHTHTHNLHTHTHTYIHILHNYGILLSLALPNLTFYIIAYLTSLIPGAEDMDFSDASGVAAEIEPSSPPQLSLGPPSLPLLSLPLGSEIVPYTSDAPSPETPITPMTPPLFGRHHYHPHHHHPLALLPPPTPPLSSSQQSGVSADSAAALALLPGPSGSRAGTQVVSRLPHFRVPENREFLALVLQFWELQ